jgi:DUF971 family protein
LIRVETISSHTRTGTLEILWSDGRQQRLTHAFLRTCCQCSHCKSFRLQGKTGEVLPEQLRITEIRPVGTYGVQLIFSDGHDRGIYPWTYLCELAQ